MAKRQSFADKASKKVYVENCMVCNSPMTPTLVVSPIKAIKGTVKYKKGVVKICKCNQKEYYG